MKRMFLDIEAAQKLSELTGNWQIWRKKSCRGQTNEKYPNFRPPAQQFFWPAAEDFKVAQLGG